MRTCFITGTDTGVGKTRAACALIRHLAASGRRVAGFKPVASGCERTPSGLRNEDALAMMAVANVELPYATVNPVALEPAIAPHIAAAQAGQAIDPQRIAQVAAGIDADHLVVEGAGGWCVPLGPGLMFADLARLLTEQVILVVGLRLGCINHALLSARQIQRDGLRLAGWIANEIDPGMPVREENFEALLERLEAPLLARIPWQSNATGTDLDQIAWRREALSVV